MSKVIFFAVVISLISSCRKPCKLPDYTFSVNDLFSPERDSINIGDTLWLTCTISKTQIDINTGTQVTFTDAENLGSSLVISDISKFNLERGAVDSFNFVKVYGDIYTDLQANPKGVKQLVFDETVNSYLLLVGLVAKKIGLYILTVTDNPDVFRRGMGKCGKADFQILNANVNKHLYLFENLWGSLSAYDRNHSYCFKVY